MWRSEEVELEGFDYIRFSGSISTLEVFEDDEIPVRRFQFGFCAPEPQRRKLKVKATPSSAWARWLP